MQTCDELYEMFINRNKIPSLSCGLMVIALKAMMHCVENEPRRRGAIDTHKRYLGTRFVKIRKDKFGVYQYVENNKTSTQVLPLGFTNTKENNNITCMSSGVEQAKHRAEAIAKDHSHCHTVILTMMILV